MQGIVFLEWWNFHVLCSLYEAGSCGFVLKNGVFLL